MQTASRTYGVGIEELGLVLCGEIGDVCTTRGGEVGAHASIEGEDGGGGANLSSHVADGGHACV